MKNFAVDCPVTYIARIHVKVEDHETENEAIEKALRVGWDERDIVAHSDAWLTEEAEAEQI